MTENKMKAPRTFRIVVASILLLSILAQWLFLKYGSTNNAQYMDDGISATILPIASPITSFHLNDHNGNTFTQDNLIGKWSIFSFGYTHCPDICPTTLNILNQVDKKLREMENPILPQTIFITLDPERDDVATLAGFVPWFNKNFIGLTGTIEQIHALTKNLGIMSQKRRDEGAEEDNYQIDHTVTIMLIDDKGQLRALSSAPHKAQTITDDFIKITEKYN